MALREKLTDRAHAKKWKHGWAGAWGSLGFFSPLGASCLRTRPSALPHTLWVGSMVSGGWTRPETLTFERLRKP